MFKSHVAVAIRKLWAERFFTLLSISGLCLATVSATIILLYVSYERSYDESVSDGVYRVVYHGYEKNVETGRSAQIIPALAVAMENDLPQIDAVVRFAHTGPFMQDPVMENGDKKFRESRIYFAGPAMLSMFSFDMISGDAAKALTEPKQVAISKSAAMKYFDTVDVLGKTITFHMGERGHGDLVISAVFEDMPDNMHFHADFLVSFATLPFNLDNNWDWGNFYTYVRLKPGADRAVFEDEIPGLLEKYVGKHLKEMSEAGYSIAFKLQPVRDIHLQSSLWGELEPNGDRTIVQFLEIVAIGILLIAWINYLNFSIARSSQNAKSISIRKISGSTRWQLVGMIITDAALVNLLTILISVAAIQVLLPVLKVAFGLPSAIAFTLQDVSLIAIIFVAGTLCSGLYPAIFISRQNPVGLLKAKVSRSTTSMRLNKALIVFQFAASVILVIGTITVFRQLEYMRNADTGLDLAHTLIIKGPAIKDSTYQADLAGFRGKIETLPGVRKFSAASSIPGEELHWGRSFHRKDRPDESAGCSIVGIDENYFPVLGVTLVAGQNYPDAEMMWQDAIIINEAAARALGFSDPATAVHETIVWNEGDSQVPKKVIGVVADFNQQSLHKHIEPIVFTLRKFVYAPWAGEYFAVNLAARDAHGVVDQMRGAWHDAFSENPFDFFFMDQYYDRQYRNEERLGNVIGVFSVIAIFVASLGLFGLTAYMTMLRTKEIGIRKVLGSTSFQLVRLLTSGYLWLIGFGFLIACPIGYYLMQSWLTNFAYQTPLNVWIFVIAGVACFGIGLLAVGIRSWQSARLNPAEAIKYE